MALFGVQRKSLIIKRTNSNRHILEVFIERWPLSWGPDWQEVHWGCREQHESGQHGGTGGTEVWPGCGSVRDLPLQFYFVGFWLGVHRVRDPAVFSAQGSGGRLDKGSIRASSLLSRRQEELLAVGQPPRACPPRAPDRQRGRRRGWGCTASLPVASPSPSLNREASVPVTGGEDEACLPYPICC